MYLGESNTTPNRSSVSVVITSYKQSSFIASAIESVLAQTHPPCEIILVDDGSPDDTATVVAPYSMVRYIYQQNQDVSAARNTGIKHATGTYLVFLDGDDRLLNHALETGVRYLDANAELGFVAGQHRYISESGSPLLSIAKRPPVTKDFYHELLHHNFIGCPATVMHRRDVLEAVGGFDININPTGDWDLYLRIAHRFPISSHDQVIAEYRRHGTNTSRNLELMLQYSIMVLGSHLKRIEGHDKEAEAACKQGIEFQRRMFRVENRIAELRTHARAKEWPALLADAAWLLFNDPKVLVENVGRKARRVREQRHGLSTTT